MKILMVLVAIAFATSAIAADFNHFTSTPKQDAATKFRCDKTKPDIVDNTDPQNPIVTPDPCTNPEAIAFAVVQFKAVLKSNVTRHQKALQSSSGVTSPYNRRIAKDSDITHDDKCAIFDAKGLKAKYSAYAQTQGEAACS